VLESRRNKTSRHGYLALARESEPMVRLGQRAGSQRERRQKREESLVNYSTEPREQAYDVIVVGSGLGGISAGAGLAKAGKNVLVVERLDGPGGYAHAFRRGPYLVDPAVHAITQSQSGGELDVWLRALGVRDRVDLVPLEAFYTVVAPALTLTVPFGIEEFIAAHVESFPDQDDGLRKLFGEAMRFKNAYDHIRLGRSMEELQRSGTVDIEAILQFRSRSTRDVLDEYLTDPHLKTVLTALWVYEGTPPSKLPFTSFAGMLVSMIQSGLSYCRGSFQSLVNAFVAVLEENGGELVVNQKVERIQVQDGRVTGVTMAGGDTIHAPIVVSNADMTQTFAELVGPEHVPEKYMRRIRQMTTSTSAFLVYTATNLDINQFHLAHEIFKLRSWDHDEAYREGRMGGMANMSITVPTMTDPSLSPEGEHLVTIVALVGYDIGRPWSQVREECAENLLNQVEEVFPGYREHLTWRESSTPLSLEKYSLNRAGAIYAWDNTVQQTANRRPDNRTPIVGLYLSSAWTRPGSGTNNTITSGMNASQMIMGYDHREQFLDSLGSPAG